MISRNGIHFDCHFLKLLPSTILGAKRIPSLILSAVAGTLLPSLYNSFNLYEESLFRPNIFNHAKSLSLKSDL